jgi:hypothetical protein
MKYNLKNKPEILMPNATDEYRVYCITAKRWFEGFEKELRSKLAPEHSLARWDSCRIFNQVIKEILGE